MDRRIRLFDIDFGELEDIDPLFTSEMIYYYDMYSDGDDFEDDGYISRFKTIVKAVKEKQPLKLEIVDKNGNVTTIKVMPNVLEYSEKDDKFRLIVSGDYYRKVINLANIVSCKPYLGENLKNYSEEVKQTASVTFTLYDERNSLERAMLHFAHFEKVVEKIDDLTYDVHLIYDLADESEILIRILSFGPFIKVTQPESFVDLIKERLKKQKNFKI